MDRYSSFSEQARSRKLITLSLFNGMAQQYMVSAPVLEYQFSTTDVKPADDKGLVIEAAHGARYNFVTAAGHSLKADIPQLPNPISIQGSWELAFPKSLGAPDHVTLDRLVSWTEHPDPGVKYFSGTATYRNRFTMRRGNAGLRPTFVPRLGACLRDCRGRIERQRSWSSVETALSSWMSPIPSLPETMIWRFGSSTYGLIGLSGTSNYRRTASGPHL